MIFAEFGKRIIPQKSAEFEQRYFDLVRSKLLLMSAEEIDKIASAGEGLGNKLRLRLDMPIVLKI